VAGVRPREYRLRSVWHLPAGREQVWRVLADPAMTWPRWWPGMSATAVHPAADGRVGSSAALELRAARWAYTLRFTIEVTTARAPVEAVLAVTGDLVGGGRVRVVGTPGGSVVRLDWDVATARPWMNATAPLLAPVFAAAHARAMRAGERGLAADLSPGAPRR
jgi:uncharacterized protein YndB with AHSA1/START domain